MVKIGPSLKSHLPLKKKRKKKKSLGLAAEDVLTANQKELDLRLRCNLSYVQQGEAVHRSIATGNTANTTNTSYCIRNCFLGN